MSPEAETVGEPGGEAVERVDADAVGPPWSQEHLARYLEMVRRGGAAGTVLDIACGSGFGSRMLAEEGAHRLVAADLAREAVVAARSSLSGVGRPSLAVRCDGTALPLAGGSVDAVACFETLEHVPDAEALLRDIRRVLGPGGRLFLSTPNGRITNPDGGEPRNPFHVREWTPEELDALVEPLFEVEFAGGQHLPEEYGVAPFLPSFRRGELDLRGRLEFLGWRILLRLPAVRDGLHRFFTGYPFFPGVEDYTFRVEDRERAHVQYLVLRKTGPE